jgi:hypothetical protein
MSISMRRRSIPDARSCGAGQATALAGVKGGIRLSAREALGESIMQMRTGYFAPLGALFGIVAAAPLRAADIDVSALTAQEVQKAFAEGRYTAEDLVDAHLARIAKYNFNHTPSHRGAGRSFLRFRIGRIVSGA